MTTRLSRAFYGPPDWIVSHTTARVRCAVGFWMCAFWLPPGPGFWMWILWIKEVWFIGLMSIVAIWLSALTIFGTETPVENEN